MTTETSSSGEIQGAMVVGSGISLETTKQVKQQVGELRRSYRRTIDQAWELGKTLSGLKQRVRHGQWLPWLGKIDLEPRVAQRCMSLYQKHPEKRLVSHFESISQALAQPTKRRVIDADFNAESAPDTKGTDEPGGNPASTASGESDADALIRTGTDVSVAATPVRSEGDEDKADVPSLSLASGKADGDSDASDDRVTAGGGNRSDGPAGGASSVRVTTYSDAARYFVQEVRGALGRAAMALQQSALDTSKKGSMDVARASSLIQDVLSVMERRIDRPQTDDLVVELGRRLRSLVEGGAHPEDDGPSEDDTRDVSTRRPSGRRQPGTRSGGI